MAKRQKSQKTTAIMLVIVCTIFTSIGQVLLKRGANVLVFDFFHLITNYFLILGAVSYGLGALILVIALQKGELSVLYPFIALSFIWVALISGIFLGEHLSLIKWGGIVLVVLGVSLIGGGSK